MNEETLLKAIGEIDEKYVIRPQQAEKRRSRWILPAVAAALALAVGLGAFFGLRGAPAPVPAQINLLHAYSAFDRRIVMSYKKDMGEDVDPVDLVFDYVVPDDTVCVMWVPFFVHDGRLYWKKGRNLDAEQYMGERVAYIKKANHRQPLDYKDDTGQFSGAVYAVNGYDPDFMLCMEDTAHEGEVRVFVCDNGYSVRTGADILEERLHASDTLVSLIYENKESVFRGYGERFSLPADEPAVRRFVEALDRSGWFVPYETEEELNELSSGRRIVTLLLGDLPVSMSVYDSGYVYLDLIGGYFLKPDEGALDSLLKLMDSSAGEPVPNTSEMRGYRLEDARKQPVYGAYIPEAIPSNLRFDYCFFNYDVDYKTQQTLAVTGMDLCWTNADERFAYVQMKFGGSELRELYSGMDDDGGIVDPFIPLSELTVDSFEVVNDDDGDFIYKVMVCDGDVYLSFTADNVDMGEAVVMIRDCFDN